MGVELSLAQPMHSQVRPSSSKCAGRCSGAVERARVAVARLLRALLAPLVDRAAAALLGRQRDRARLADAPRARPGDLPVRRLGAPAGTGRLPRRARRQRAADAPGPRGLPRARRRRRSSLPRARPRRDGRVVRVRGRCLAGLGHAAARRAGRARRVGAGGMGGAERAVPPLRLLGPRPARELLRLVHAPERRAAARRAGAADAPPIARAPTAARGARRVLLGVVGALSLVPWFGKPTFALFTFAQLAAIAADDELVLCREGGPSASFAIGGALSAAVALALARRLRRRDGLRAHPALGRPGALSLSLAARGRRHLLESRGARRRRSSRSPAPCSCSRSSRSGRCRAR